MPKTYAPCRPIHEDGNFLGSAGQRKGRRSRQPKTTVGVGDPTSAAATYGRVFFADSGLIKTMPAKTTRTIGSNMATVTAGHDDSSNNR